MKQYDILIVGAGASGLCAAIEAAASAETSLKIGVLEKEKTPAKKILATGNGRCNFANRDAQVRYYCGGKDLVRQVWKQYPPHTCTEFFDAIGIPATDDGSGRLYPMSRKASSVAQALTVQARRLGVEILTEHTVSRIKASGDFFLVDNDFRCRCLILAFGSAAGLAGGNAFNGGELLRAFPIRCKPAYPCLCGLVPDKSYPHAWKGVRNICTVTILVDGRSVFSEKGEVQFNEKSISGIPVMQGSCFASEALLQRKKVKIKLDMLPEFSRKELSQRVAHRAGQMHGFAAESVFTGFLPKPLYFHALKKIGVSPSEMLPDDEKILSALADHMKYAEFDVTDTVGLGNAQACGGGVDCAELHADTMELKKVPGLYVCGEAADVVGMCGGYNLMWAWCSGRLAGFGAAKRLTEKR